MSLNFLTLLGTSKKLHRSNALFSYCDQHAIRYIPTVQQLCALFRTFTAQPAVDDVRASPPRSDLSNFLSFAHFWRRALTALPTMRTKHLLPVSDRATKKTLRAAPGLPPVRDGRCAYLHLHRCSTCVLEHHLHDDNASSSSSAPPHLRASNSIRRALFLLGSRGKKSTTRWCIVLTASAFGLPKQIVYLDLAVSPEPQPALIVLLERTRMRTV